MIFHALLDDIHVHFKIQMIHPDRVFHIGFRRSDGNQRHNHIAFFNMILDPFPVDGDIPLQKIELWIVQCSTNAFCP